MNRRTFRMLGANSNFRKVVTAAAIALAGQQDCVSQAADRAPSEQRASAPSRRPRDEVWLVNCRNAALNGDLTRLSFAVHRASGGWSAAGQNDLGSSTAPAANCLLVLGNGYTASQTQSLGLSIYRRLTDGLPTDVAVRFMIWSWPSDETELGPIKDVRLKAARTPQVAKCLARWLDDTPLPGKLSLLGTSFGARIVMEALELRAGGRIGNLQSENANATSRRPVDVVLISAALDNDWLYPGRRLGSSLEGTDRLLLINNHDDSVLARYRWLYGRRSNAMALGVTGIATSRLGQRAGKILQIDAAWIIGRQHGCSPYFDSAQLLAAMRPVLFGEPALSPPSQGATIPMAKRNRGAGVRR